MKARVPERSIVKINVRSMSFARNIFLTDIEYRGSTTCFACPILYDKVPVEILESSSAVLDTFPVTSSCLGLYSHNVLHND